LRAKFRYESIWHLTIPGDQTSVTYNSDGQANRDLHDDGTYNILLHTYDGNGNQATIMSVFKVNALDTDGDGVLDDGSFNGMAGDRPCTGGEIITCDDNCKNDLNPDQADSDGDGVGNVCEPQIEVAVGGYSVYESWSQKYFINFYANDPNHVADTVIVTGPGIDGSLSLPYWEGPPGGWGTDPFFYLGQNLPAPPPLTFTFHIFIDGVEHNQETTIQSFVHEFATDLSPTGIASGDIIFSWIGVSLPGASYFVQLSEENGSLNWTSPSTTNNFINYAGPPFSSGSRYIFDVWARDSFGNYSVAEEEFVYGGPHPRIYFEDFEDGSLNPPFRQDGQSYEIINGIFHMYEGTDYPEVGLQGANVGIPIDNELIYQFEADVYVSSVIDQNVGLYVSFLEPSGHDWVITLYIEKAPELSFTAYLSKDGEILDYPVLGPANHNQWYSLSITLHDDYVTIGIDETKTNLFCGLFQKPSSVLSSGGDVKAQVPIPNDLDYYVDNLVARTSPLSLPEVPTPTGLAADYDESNNWNWITWIAVPEAESYNLYWGTESGVTKCSEYAGNTRNTAFIHSALDANKS